MPLDLTKINKEKIPAITTTEGPLLVIAGPGTGKTYTLVNRILYLIMDKGVTPDQMLVVTFTEKAAKELVSRVSDALINEGVDANLSDMKIGTIHSVFGNIMTDYIDSTDLQKNYIMLDEYMQKDLIRRNLKDFEGLPNYHALDKLLWKYSSGYYKPTKKIVNEIENLVNGCREEIVSVNDLKMDARKEVLAVAEILEKYDSILKEHNAIDFSGILVKMYKLLSEHPEVCREVSEKYRYIMVDEYQDTNYIQDQTLKLIAGSAQNICVVGDDDQSLYRFRGATVNNILSFPDRYKRTDGKDGVVKLLTNFRSSSDIIDFYNHWMDDTAGGGAEGFIEWKKARFKKTIKPEKPDNTKAVFKLKAPTLDEWYKSIYNMIYDLKDSKKIEDYNQIAFLVQVPQPISLTDRYTGLIKYLEDRGINTYAPRFGLFYDRQEIKEIIGCLLATYPPFMTELETDTTYGIDELRSYYKSCLDAGKIAINANKELATWVDDKRRELANLSASAGYAFTDMVYELLRFEPFSEYVKAKGSASVGSVLCERAARNIAILIDLISYYETTNNLIDGFDPAYYKKNIYNFFRYYIYDRKQDRTDEYDDDCDYAPKGCVSFMTIHQSKGLEFPIVIAGCDGKPFGGDNKLIKDYIRPDYYHSIQVEEPDKMIYNDFWRAFYTAFSRAETMLVLTLYDGCMPLPPYPFYFKNVFDALPDYELAATKGMTFRQVKKSTLKNTYSFTSHLGVYETCPRQYYFFRKLGFSPCRTVNTLFGTLVHETIEDVNKAAIAGRIGDITEANVELWLNNNYNTLMNAEHYHMSSRDKDEAKRQVMGYVAYAGQDWSLIKETEVEVKDIRKEFILLGKVDLVQGVGNTYELVDFKTGDKPGPNDKSELLKHYKEQLITYSHLVSQRTGKVISKAHLYYTKVTTGDPRITIDVTQKGIDMTMKRFEDIVKKIEKDDFSGYACEKKTCHNCDLRHFCQTDPKSPVYKP